MITSYILYIDLSKVADNTIKVSRVTHADPRCTASCVAVTTAVSYEVLHVNILLMALVVYSRLH